MADLQIYTYSSGSEELPRNERAIARIKAPQVTGSGKSRAVRMDWHPVIIQAETQDLAREKAEKWWADQLAAERRKIENAAARVLARQAKAASPPLAKREGV